MSQANKLKSLIDLIGNEEIYSCNVSINEDLDANALKDLHIFQQSRTAEESAIYQKILQDDFQCPKSSTKKETNWTYATCVFEILLQINAELENHDETPITINEAKKMHIGIRKAIEYGLKPLLLDVSTSLDLRLPYIITCIKVLLNIVNGKLFPLIFTRNDQHLIYTDLLSSIFIILCYAGDEVKSHFEANLFCIQSKLSHVDYFKILFLIKGNKTNQSESLTQKIVHKQLMETLYRPGSFKALCEALLPSVTSLDQDEEIVKRRLHSCAVISTIVGQKGHTRKFYHQMIDEIHKHLISFIQSNKSHQLFFVDVGVRCLSTLSTLQMKFIQHQILDLLLGTFNKLATPPDLISGAIVCESNEFLEAVHLVHLTFCASGPSDCTIPSKFLTSFMPLFIQLHHILIHSKNKSIKNEILAVIVRCLSNQKKSDMKKMIESVLFEEYGENVKNLHPRLKNSLLNSINEENESYVFSVAAPVQNSIDTDLDINSFLQSSISLISVLKQCGNNLLIYNVFLHFLEIFSDIFTTLKLSESSCSSELLTSEDELKKAIEIKFKRKYAIVYALNELILFKPFHGQFAENPHDIVALLDKILYQQIEHIKLAHRSEQLLGEDFDEILVVILSCIGELTSYVKDDDLKVQLEKTLQKLKTQLQNDKIRETASSKIILRKVDMLLDNHRSNCNENSEFHVYKAILSETSSEPYTKVYGIMNLIKLIKAKDEDTCTNAHILLVLTVKLLKEEEDSYIFLNCIKLLVALFEVLNGTVLETLISEYHFNIDDDAVNIDFKLKIGETIIKVTEGLGEMSFKYKDILINGFLKGVNNHNNEFRTSNMSNLGVIMRILSYQVHHFIQEVMLLIQNILLHEKYLPMRRAAALVLTDLLRGMQSIEQYQECLLPIYRNLKNIAENDGDLQMQIHARNGLESLKDKIKEAFTADTKMEKEIRIFDIKKNETTLRYN